MPASPGRVDADLCLGVGVQRWTFRKSKQTVLPPSTTGLREGAHPSSQGCLFSSRAVPHSSQTLRDGRSQAGQVSRAHPLVLTLVLSGEVLDWEIALGVLKIVGVWIHAHFDKHEFLKYLFLNE